jgi:hypothetical protein
MPRKIVGNWMGIDLLQDVHLFVVEVEATYFMVIGIGHARTLGDEEELPHNRPYSISSLMEERDEKSPHVRLPNFRPPHPAPDHVAWVPIPAQMPNSNSGVDGVGEMIRTLSG